MMADEQVFGPERELFDEVVNTTIMKELDPTGTYVVPSWWTPEEIWEQKFPPLIDEFLKPFMPLDTPLPGNGFDPPPIQKIANELTLSWKVCVANESLTEEDACLPGNTASV